MGSSTSHPVRYTITTPSTTPSEVHTSVNRCCASARSVIERSLRPARNSTSATPPLTAVATSVTERPSPRFCSGCGSSEPFPRRDPDPGRRDDDERALQPAREILGLVVAEGVLLVRRTHRQGQRPQRRHRRDEVDHRLGRVGEEPDRARELVGPELEPDGDDRGRDREPGVAARGAAVRSASLRHRGPVPEDVRHKAARIVVNVGITASTFTFYHLPDKRRRKPAGASVAADPRRL